MVIHTVADQTTAKDQLTTERMKMRSGQPFNSLDIELRLLREKARLACGKYNAHPSKGNFKHISRLFNKLSTAVIEPGFQCDYGGQISLGDNFYANFNCVMLDSASMAQVFISIPLIIHEMLNHEEKVAALQSP